MDYLTLRSAGTSYGYALIQSLTGVGIPDLRGGTIYPLLARLEQEGLVSSEWRAGDGGPGRKYFTITPAGRGTLAKGSAGWTDFAARIGFTGSVDLTARLLGTWVANVAVALVVIHLLFAQLASHTAGSAKPRAITSRYIVLGSLAMTAGLTVLVLIPVLVPTGPTMVSVPDWALVVAGLLVSLASLRQVNLDRVVDPRG